MTIGVIFRSAVEHGKRKGDFDHPNPEINSKRWALHFEVWDHDDSEVPTESCYYPFTTHSKGELSQSQATEQICRTMCCALMAVYMNKGALGVKNLVNTQLDEDVDLGMVADFMRLSEPKRKVIEINSSSFNEIEQYRYNLYGTLKLIGYMRDYDSSATNVSNRILNDRNEAVFDTEEFNEWIDFKSFVLENSGPFEHKKEYMDMLDDIGLNDPDPGIEPHY